MGVLEPGRFPGSERFDVALAFAAEVADRASEVRI
jgi:hypothetical protein